MRYSKENIYQHNAAQLYNGQNVGFLLTDNDSASAKLLIFYEIIGLISSSTQMTEKVVQTKNKQDGRGRCCRSSANEVTSLRITDDKGVNVNNFLIKDHANSPSPMKF
jgi:hypothetical protein